MLWFSCFAALISYLMYTFVSFLKDFVYDSLHSPSLELYTGCCLYPAEQELLPLWHKYKDGLVATVQEVPNISCMKYLEEMALSKIKRLEKSTQRVGYCTRLLFPFMSYMTSYMQKWMLNPNTTTHKHCITYLNFYIALIAQKDVKQ